MKKTVLFALALAFVSTGTVYAEHKPEVSPELSGATTAVKEEQHAECHIEENITLGSRGESVECLQKHLIEDELLGIASPTGYFGELTKSAVMKWQEEKGLPATGFFGALSRAAFESHKEDAKPHTPTAEMHPAIDVAQWPTIPSASITVHADVKSGYNLEISAQNFRFAPEHASGQALPNEGHAHLMVNGKKLARVYGNWFHIPAEAVHAGENEILLTLNANDHSDLEYNGVRIQAKQTITK